MKALLMRRTPAIALACAVAATAAIGVGVAQASAADIEASDTVALQERIDGEVNDSGVYVDVDDQTEESEGGATDATVEETESLADAGITDDGIENEAPDNAEAKLVAGKKDAKKSGGAKASASASNVIEEADYIEIEEVPADELDDVNAEITSSKSSYLDEDEPVNAIAEVPGE